MGGAGKFATVKLAGLTAGAIVLMRVFSALHRSIAFFAAKGAFARVIAGAAGPQAAAAATANLATQQQALLAGGLLTRRAHGLMRVAPLAKTAGFAGLLLGPTGAATAAIIGLTLAIGFLVGKFRELRQESSLAVKFLTQEDISVEKIPVLKSFQEFAQKLDTGPAQLLGVLKQTAAEEFARLSALAADAQLQRVPGFGFGIAAGRAEGNLDLIREDFPEALRILRDEANVTRYALGETFIGALGEAFPKFNDYIDDFVKQVEKIEGPLDDAKKAALRTQEAMRLFAQATEISSGILGANIERLTTAANNMQNQTSAAFAKAEQFFAEQRERGGDTRVGFDPRRLLDRIRGKGLVEAAPLNVALLEGVAVQETESTRAVITEGIAEAAVSGAIDDIRNALRRGFEKAEVNKDLAAFIVSSLTVDQDVLEGALDQAAAAGRNVDWETFFGFITQGIRDRLKEDPEKYKTEFTNNLANFLREALVAGNVEELGFGMLAPESPLQQTLNLLNETFPDALKALRNQLIDKDIDPEVLVLIDRILAQIGKGAKIASSTLQATFVNIRNPLDDFIKDFYIAEQRILANVDAAQRLGLAFDEVGERLKNLQ
jgi:hypothetical protein